MWLMEDKAEFEPFKANATCILFDCIPPYSGSYAIIPKIN